MADETRTSDSKSNKGCYLVISRVIAFIIVVYLIQWILQMLFEAPQSDVIAAALKPFQNHYLSFSKYFITTEASSGEFTDDMTGAGRFIWFLVFGGALWLILLVIFSQVPALKNSLSTIIWTFTVIIVGIIFYWAFFVPYTKVIFTDTEMVIERTEYIFSKEIVHIPFKSIESFEYEFHEHQEVHTGHQLYAQLFAIIGGKRILVGENQISIERSDAKPTRVQRQEVENAVGALRQLIGQAIQ